jgi:hypothetical protein
MNTRFIIALAALVTSFAVQAAEPATVPVKPAPPTPAATTPAAQKGAPVAQKTAALSQQDRMRECNKQATGKKGAERKTFMKTCLSRKA